MEIPLPRGQGQAVKARSHQGGKVHPLPFEGDAPLQPGQIQQLPHQGRHAVALVQHHI